MNVTHVNMYLRRSTVNALCHCRGQVLANSQTRLFVEHHMNLGCPQPSKHLTPERSFFFFFFPMFTGHMTSLVYFFFYYYFCSLPANMHFIICEQGDAHCLCSDAWVLFLTMRSDAAPGAWPMIHPTWVLQDVSGRSWKFGVQKLLAAW